MILRACSIAAEGGWSSRPNRWRRKRQPSRRSCGSSPEQGSPIGQLMRLTVEPRDGDFVTVTYRNGFSVGYPRTASDASRNALIEFALRLWLRKRLREDVLALVRVHGEPNGLKPRRVHIKDQAHIWGSCGVDRAST